MRRNKSQAYRYLFFSLFISIGFLLSGCLNGGYWVWQHPEGLPNAELQRAKLECRQLANKEIDRFDYYYPTYYEPFYHDYYYRHGHRHRHHRRHYWHRPYYDFHRYNIDLDRLYKICMNAKGWQLFHYENPPQDSK